MGDVSYNCDKCPRTFKLEEFYDKHKKVHELKKQHTCEICGFVYGAAKGLEGHVKTHTEEEVNAARRVKEPPYNMDFHFLNPRGVLAQAPTVGSRLKEKSLSMEMMAVEEGDRNVKNQSPAGTGTYEVYDSVPDASDPSVTSQNDSGFFTCTICKREFSGLNSLKKHVPIHTRRVQHSCDVCGYVFGKKEYLMDHVRKHTGEISPVCEVCGQTFNKSLKLKEHFKLHRNLLADGSSHEVLPFRCHVCREVFQQADVLGNHLTSAHAETVYKCDMCEASFGDVRGKNHHMYNEHQMDAFHTKCVWCPVCNQGFTRHYNLKVHMFKTHGKEYIDNNFSAEEFSTLVKPPPSNGVSARSSSLDKQLSHLDFPHTKEPNTIAKTNLQNGGINHYFDQKKGTQILSCQLCHDKFMRKSDLLIHLENTHHIPLSSGSPFMSSGLLEPKAGQKNHVYDDDEPPMITIKPVRSKIGPKSATKRKPGPASKTNAPLENRVTGNIPSYIDDALFDIGKNGFECKDCGKVLQHKQSFVSHMRVIHGNYYGGNKWRGHSSVVDMILEESSKLSPKKRHSKSGADANATMCSVCEQVFPNQSSLRNHIVNVHIQGQNFTCDLCGKAFLCQENLDAHTKSKHPNLNKRLQSLRDALGLSDEQPEAKRSKSSLSDKHKKETDELNHVNGVKHVGQIHTVDPIEEDEENEEEILKHQLQSRTESMQLADDDEEEDEEEEEEDVRYEPITEAFVFEDQVIHPCYIVLPFVTDNDAETLCQRSIGVYYGDFDEMDEDDEDEEDDDEDEEEGQLTIDESKIDEEVATLEEDSPMLESLLHKPAKELGLSGGELLHKPANGNYNAEEIKIDPLQMGFYPNLGDFSLPFSLSSIWKKKMDILPPETIHQLEMIKKMEEIKQMNAPAVSHKISKPKPKSKQKSGNKTTTTTIKTPNNNNTSSSGKILNSEGGTTNSTTQVSDYESQVQNDIWPLDCIKCNTLLGNLDNFNLHMNDHWSEDKCCPVCGLLINSKRFNFKQHLKIHTGEKPFTCQVCNRSFRQKAHMVKHVTTHRSMPGGSADNSAMAVK